MHNKHMGIKSDEDKKKIWQCECKKTLGFLVDDHIAIIQGMNGQEYEINFNNIKLTCNKCGKEIFRDSTNSMIKAIRETKSSKKVKNAILGIIQSPAINIPHFRLKKYYRTLLLNKLTEKQKDIYKLMIDVNRNAIPYERISLETNLSLDIVKKNVEKILNVYDEIMHIRASRIPEDDE